MEPTLQNQLQAIIDTPDADISSMLVADAMSLAVALQKQVKVLARALLNMQEQTNQNS